MAVGSLSQTKARRAPGFSLIPKGKLARKEAFWFWGFISPWVIGFLIFTLGPIIASAYLSFTTYNISSPPDWVGLQNYRNLFKDPIFWKSLQVSAYYTAMSVPSGIIASLLLALLLNQKVPALGLFRTLFYLPSIIPGVAAAILFAFLLNPQFGVFNYVIRSLVGTNGIIPLGLNGP